MAELLLDFADEVLAAVREHKGVDVEDVRSRLLGPLRSYVRDHLGALDGSPAPAEQESTSSMVPCAGARGA